MTTQQQVKYHLSGDLLGACSCDWGCPCNFEAAPTQGWRADPGLVRRGLRLARQRGILRRRQVGRTEFRLVHPHSGPVTPG